MHLEFHLACFLWRNVLKKRYYPDISQEACNTIFFSQILILILLAFVYDLEVISVMKTLLVMVLDKI